jgi:hypothetical protein
VADPLTQARTYYLVALVADRQRRSTNATPQHLEAAAALPVDLWVAARHGITPNHHARSFHLPRATLDTITAPRKRHHAGRPWAGR